VLDTLVEGTLVLGVAAWACGTLVVGALLPGIELAPGFAAVAVVVVVVVAAAAAAGLVGCGALGVADAPALLLLLLLLLVAAGALGTSDGADDVLPTGRCGGALDAATPGSSGGAVDGLVLAGLLGALGAIDEALGLLGALVGLASLVAAVVVVLALESCSPPLGLGLLAAGAAARLTVGESGRFGLTPGRAVGGLSDGDGDGFEGSGEVARGGSNGRGAASLLEDPAAASVVEAEKVPCVGVVERCVVVVIVVVAVVGLSVSMAIESSSSSSLSCAAAAAARTSQPRIAQSKPNPA